MFKLLILFGIIIIFFRGFKIGGFEISLPMIFLFSIMLYFTSPKLQDYKPKVEIIFKRIIATFSHKKTSLRR